MSISIFREDCLERVWFEYTGDMNPCVEDRGLNGFTVYFDGVDEDGYPCDCVCDYPSNYYYEVSDGQ